MKLLVPLSGILLLLSASCKKEIEEIAVTKRDTVKVQVDSSNYKRATYAGNVHYTQGDYYNSQKIDSNYSTNIVVTWDYKSSTVQFGSTEPFTGFFQINDSNVYIHSGNTFRIVGDYLYASYSYNNGNGSGPPSIIKKYDFSGKK